MPGPGANWFDNQTLDMCVVFISVKLQLILVSGRQRGGTRRLNHYQMVVSLVRVSTHR